MMTRLNLDTADEGVRWFILSAVLTEEGSVLELGGRTIALLVPASSSGPEEPRTEAKNRRRCELIDRKYAVGLAEAEALELARLQEQILRHQEQVAPWPVEEARRLYRELLDKLASCYRRGF
jgi:hypothetical protein